MLRALVCGCMCLLILPMLGAQSIPSSERSRAAIARQTPALREAVQALGLAWGAEVFIRIHKAEDELELYLRGAQGWQLFRTWPICDWSGELGPKLREGDRQAPEGWYEVAPGQMNPVSRFHLSFNLGYPNAHDRHHDRTGSLLMVHGSCVSIGCYAMTDAVIEEIWTLMTAAYAAGQPRIAVLALPMRMDAGWESRAPDSEWTAFWRDLAAIDHAFRAGTLRSVAVRDGRYVVVGM